MLLIANISRNTVTSALTFGAILLVLAAGQKPPCGRCEQLTQRSRQAAFVRDVNVLAEKRLKI